MDTKGNLSRITIDIPATDHKKLKARAALLGKSMREIILEALESMEPCFDSDHIPNKKTVQAIKDIERKKGLATAQEIKDFSKKMGL